MGIVCAALLFVGFYGILLAERRCPTKRRRLLLLTGLAVLLFGAKQAREGQLFGVPLPTLTAKGGMPYDYIGNSIAFPDDHRTVGTSRKCCTSDGRPEKG